MDPPGDRRTAPAPAVTLSGPWARSGRVLHGALLIIRTSLRAAARTAPWDWAVAPSAAPVRDRELSRGGTSQVLRGSVRCTPHRRVSPAGRCARACPAERLRPRWKLNPQGTPFVQLAPCPGVASSHRARGPTRVLGCGRGPWTAPCWLGRGVRHQVLPPVARGSWIRITSGPQAAPGLVRQPPGQRPPPFQARMRHSNRDQVPLMDVYAATRTQHAIGTQPPQLATGARRSLLLAVYLSGGQLKPPVSTFSRRRRA